MDREYKSNHNVVYSCKYHVVWCSKYRRKVLVGEVETRLKELVTSICEENGIELLAIELMPDHIGLSLEVEPQLGIHRAVKAIKGKTSRILREEFPSLRTRIPTLWTNSYYVSTIGEESEESVEQYIRSQETSQRK
ncbi:MAG: IS200/IS605 family transposase [Lachnospiraceae bacterium]|nr:IS200/IS605 family transposase [Robinsoniella sp.]MDY3765081.1 IS200/IS605 family transposase [Lachnospiraceae bacterium]